MSKVIKQHAGLKTAPFEPPAMRWILGGPCRIHEVSFDPNNSRLSDFNEGCRFVGKQIAEVLRTNIPELIERLRRNDDTSQ